MEVFGGRSTKCNFMDILNTLNVYVMFIVTQTANISCNLICMMIFSLYWLPLLPCYCLITKHGGHLMLDMSSLYLFFLPHT